MINEGNNNEQSNSNDATANVESTTQEFEGLDSTSHDNKIYRITGETKEEIVETDRPAWLNDRFEKPEDLAKAYDESQKYISSTRRAEVPETYEFKMNEDLSEHWNIPDDDPMLASFKEYARNNKFDQDQFNSAINFYVKQSIDSNKNSHDALDAETQAVLKEVGYNTTPEIAKKEMKNWLLNNTSTANEGDIDAILMDPSAIKLVAMLKNNTSLGIPNPSGEVTIKGMNYFLEKKADPRYLRDKGFTDRVDSEFADAVGRGWL